MENTVNMSWETVKAVPIPVGLAQVSDAELARFADLIYARTGIRVSPQKKTLLSNRLRRRLRETGIATFNEYYQHLCSLPPAAPEWDAFLQEITTHETYLFRDEVQWEWFRQQYLPAIDAECLAERRPRSLRIWSAASSTGDEAFTAACCVAACLPNLSQWTVRILGTDIGVGALDHARNATFGERAMRLVPEALRNRFFVKAKDEPLWQARPVLTAMVAFRQHNLMTPLREMPFDLVFLKNVLIYFDTASKLTVLSNVRALVRPGGLLMAGAAEGVSDLLKGFERVEPWLFRKPKQDKVVG